MKRQKKCSQMSTNLLTPEIILEMEAKGYSITEIAKELGISRQYLYEFRKKNNIEVAKRGRKAEEINTVLLTELHSNGFSDAVIAKNLGVSRSKVVRARQKLNLKSNFKVGERGPGKLRDNVSYLNEVRRIFNDSKTAKIIHKAARLYREQGGDEETAWAATLIEPAKVYHPDPGSYCTSAEKTNLSHVKYAVQLESKQDFAGLCGLPSVQLLEKALECRGLAPSQLEELDDILAELVTYSGYMGSHVTTEQARFSTPDSVHRWNHIWNHRLEESKAWAPVQKESAKKTQSCSFNEYRASNGKKGKGGGVQNTHARQAYLGAAGY